MIGYLGSYMSGTCIGDKRILDDDGTHVTIRIKDYRRGGALDTIKITGVKFIERFVQHLFPARFRRVRYSGLWGPRKREDYLEQCRELLQDRMPPPEEPGTATDDECQEPAEELPEEEESETAPKSCPRCHGSDLIYIEQYWPEGHWESTDSAKPAEYYNSTYLWDAWDAVNTQASQAPAGAVPT